MEAAWISGADARAPDRAAAIARMRRALGELRADGPSVTTTAAFLSDLIDHPRFRAAEHDTAMVTALFAGEKPAN